ncbi:hypothetical protein PGTUg99_035369 [Puccinia graminis f. sp. tritici]|uniref:Uncharacterized protein n=1 Tax=Puccinia graminis f. sp. tritici TaxID=56615 RepID=A0A5B0M8V1_PUCGR|nr:hypothetical protein PGTUg99_007125 [Puccinia graminis f. sp. tritici]KAA1073041.1 hypothetical protein PGTUg99_022830 [Puccinia graminis f. sp. tritici]KAA1131991.1 hypothetical protein PGTUg99_035369 [Puccinia graminis f. sp. tritici]
MNNPNPHYHYHQTANYTTPSRNPPQPRNSGTPSGRHVPPNATGGNPLGPHRVTPTDHRFHPHNHQMSPPGNDNQGSPRRPATDGRMPRTQEGPDLGDYNDGTDLSDLMDTGLLPALEGEGPRGAGAYEDPPLPPPLELGQGDVPPLQLNMPQQRPEQQVPPDLQPQPPVQTTEAEVMRRFMDSPDGMATILGALIQRGGAASNPVAITSRHIYGPVVREYLRIEIRRIMKRHTLAAYSKSYSQNGERLTNGPFPLIRVRTLPTYTQYLSTRTDPLPPLSPFPQAQVLAQPAAWRHLHLPAGLASNTNDAIQNLDQFLRTMVKHERTTLRNLLLIQVRPDPRKRAPGPIPRLFDLLVLIEQGLTPRHETRTRDQVAEWATRPVRLRFALLRLLAVHHYINRPPGQTLSQWEIIDRHLEMLAGPLSPVELQAHIELIIRKDSEYFDGIKRIEDIPPATFHLPTDAEISQEIARLNRSPVVTQEAAPPGA